MIRSLNNAIDACDEGIMIKDPDSVYKPGSRTKSGWIKIKPEYQKDLTDTCDLVILGGKDYYHNYRKWNFSRKIGPSVSQCAWNEFKFFEE